MKANPKGVLSGTHNLSGSEACIEGALAAGCRFLGYYPTSSTINLINHFIKRSKDTDSKFVQMEDEISALATVIGASWAGVRSLTVTSSPGFSNMMEHIGLGAMLETPLVIVDLQAAGPGEGNPDLPSQGDMMQSRWGSHGDYEVISLSPSSPQEMFDYTIKAFNLSEQFRTPVMIMSDSYIANIREEVIIPPASEIELVQRRYYNGQKDRYLPFNYEDDLVPPMVNIGNGYRFHVTGLTHDERGYPVMNEECQELNVHRIVNKIRRNADKICEVNGEGIDSAETVVISYGLTSRATKLAIEKAKELGAKVGSLKLTTIWPFPDKYIRQLASKVMRFIVPEVNMGQIVHEVERCSYGQANVLFLKCSGSEIDDSDRIFNAIMQNSRSK